MQKLLVHIPPPAATHSQSPSSATGLSPTYSVVPPYVEPYRLIFNNEVGTKNQKVNSRHPVHFRRPTLFHCALLRFVEANGDVCYFQKTRHSRRKELSGAYGHLSESKMMYRYKNTAIERQPTAKFIKTLTVSELLTIDNLIQGAKITQQMYPGTQFYCPKNNKVLIMMDSLPGKDLFTWISSGELDQFDLISLHKIAIAVVKELMRLFAFGHIHCDFKPENILLDEYLRVYLVDFDCSVPANESNVARGSPGYAPVGLFTGVIPANSMATELFSLAIVLFAIYGGYAALEKIIPPDLKGPALMQFLEKFQKNELTEEFIFEKMLHKDRNIAQMLATIFHPQSSKPITTATEILTVLEAQLSLCLGAPMQSAQVSPRKN